MGLLDVFKKKKKEKKKAKKPPKLKKKEEIKEPALEEIAPPLKAKKAKKKDFSEAYRTLKGAHITEKATDLGKENKYVFKVFPNTNKIEVKKAVQDLYGVEVLDVNIINIHQKSKRLAGRRGAGHKSGYKKAIVTLAEGEKIELLPT